MKLKNDIKKYMTLGAALAASTFMVSCDGDDGAAGKDGQDGANGQNVTDNLPVAVPTDVNFALAKLSAIVNSVPASTPTPAIWNTGQPVTAGNQLKIDFNSTSFADYEVQIPGGLNLTNTPINFTRVSETQFRVVRDSAVNNEINILFTVTSTSKQTLLGTFTASARGAQTGVGLFVNTIPTQPVPVNSPTGITVNAVGTTANNAVIQNASAATIRTLASLPTGTAVVTVDGQSGLFISTGNITGSNVDVSGLDTSTTNNVVFQSNGTVATGSTIDATWKRVQVQTAEVIEDAYQGTFRMDLNPSIGGTDTINVGGLEN